MIYTYDALNRVKTVTIDWLPDRPGATYSYDEAGRMTSLTTFNGITTSYGYDASNRITIVNDNGTSSTIGSYPGVVRDDSSRVPTSSHSWEISQSQADAAFAAMNQPGYNFFTHNCVDQVAGALDSSGINHPSFGTLGVSDPSKLNAWLNSLNTPGK